MQAKGSVLPKFDGFRNQPKARPMLRPGHRAKAEFRRIFGNALFQLETSDQGTRLPRGPGADLAAAGPAGKIDVGFGRGDRTDRAIDPNLTPQAFPMQTQRRLGIGGKLVAFLALEIRIKKRSPGDRIPSTAPCAPTGVPSAVLVAKAMALGSLGSCFSASFSHSSEKRKGGPWHPEPSFPVRHFPSIMGPHRPRR